MYPRMRAVMLTVSLALFFTFFAVQHTLAEAVVENSSGYNVLTHVVVGTNSQDKRKKLSKSVSAALESVRRDFNYEFYSRELTHFQSVGNGGNIGFNSISRGLGSLKAMENPIFSQLNLDGFSVEQNATDSVAFKAFRFQARLPVRFRRVEEEPGDTSRVRYEAIKISLNHIRLNTGKPRLIASLPLPDHDETLFFILEVRKG